jgi:uncharacterized membrane protein
MKFDIKRAIFMNLLIIILFQCMAVSFAEEAEFQVESTTLQVYRDGLVRVTQTLIVNETVPAITLPLFASSVDNLFVLDENQTVLDYKIEGINLTVFSLGTTNVLLQYDTQYLTRKDFDVWSLIVDSPYNVTAVLPEESTVIFLSGTPTSIDSENNKLSLSLFPSQWEISYIFPLDPPAAEFQISELEVKPLEAMIREEVTISIKINNVGGQIGSHELVLKINQIIEETRTVTLEKGESTVAEFKVTKQTPGTYKVDLANLASEFTVKEASPNEEPSNGEPSNGEPSNGTPSNLIQVEYIIASVLVIVAVLVAIFLFLRRRRYDVEKIFKRHPQLNTDEKDVIQFLADNEGKVFESQIREKFPEMPRTSLWRLVKRLETLEIIKVTKVGVENMVKLKK